MNKKILFIMFLIIYLFPFIFSKAANLRDSVLSIAQIELPYTIIYDDGLERKVYPSFEVLNEKNEIVLKHPSSYDVFPTISLKSGIYKIIYKNENGEKIEKIIKIETKNK